MKAREGQGTLRCMALAWHHLMHTALVLMMRTHGHIVLYQEGRCQVQGARLRPSGKRNGLHCSVWPLPPRAQQRRAARPAGRPAVEAAAA